jgi:anti-anti-sigma factor
MKVELRQFDDAELLLLLSGDFDAAGASAIRTEMEQIAVQPGPANVVLDIGDVTFIDSSGIGAIVFLFKRLRAQNRQLRISSATGQPAELLALLRVHKAIPIELAQNQETTTCVA